MLLCFSRGLGKGFFFHLSGVEFGLRGNNRIDKRFNIMMERGALKECENILKLGLWDEHHPSCKAIGAKELISHLQNGDNLKDAISLAIIQTRQYAKRQRTWFRSKMLQWHKIDVESIHEYIR